MKSEFTANCWFDVDEKKKLVIRMKLAFCHCMQITTFKRIISILIKNFSKRIEYAK